MSLKSPEKLGLTLHFPVAVGKTRKLSSTTDVVVGAGTPPHQEAVLTPTCRSSRKRSRFYSDISSSEGEWDNADPPMICTPKGVGIKGQRTLLRASLPKPGPTRKSISREDEEDEQEEEEKKAKVAMKESLINKETLERGPHTESTCISPPPLSPPVDASTERTRDKKGSDLLDLRQASAVASVLPIPAFHCILDVCNVMSNAGKTDTLHPNPCFCYFPSLLPGGSGL